MVSNLNRLDIDRLVVCQSSIDKYLDLIRLKNMYYVIEEPYKT